MKRFASQYIITNSGPLLKRGIITADDSGVIIAVEDTEGNLKEEHSTEFHNGIIIPGFVNCHCHLELSHLKNCISKETGLGGFIEQVKGTRELNNEDISSAISSADNLMYKEGVVLCADICNTSDSFNIKKESKIKYINLLEVFGLDPEKAIKRFDEIIRVAEKAEELDLIHFLVPHSAYSMSLSLFRLLRNKSLHNRVTSIHFMESAGENTFLSSHTGSLLSSYERSGLLPPRLETALSHTDIVISEISNSGNLILVHNTFADRDSVRSVQKRENLYWCLCPNSNLYIENKVPPLSLFQDEDCDIVIGTDSLASNSQLSVLEELKTLQSAFPDTSIQDLIKWATINGARALCEEAQFGSIETGKKPGLLLLQNVDLKNVKLLPNSFVTRLI
jgi:cytosine/adenosine deaminase-related metal-dependent hydrolase